MPQFLAKRNIALAESAGYSIQSTLVSVKIYLRNDEGAALPAANLHIF
jgi:hypothetical protein